MLEFIVESVRKSKINSSQVGKYLDRVSVSYVIDILQTRQIKTLARLFRDY